MDSAHLSVRQFGLIVAVVPTGGLLLLLREPTNASHAALSSLPTLTPVYLPLLGGNLSLSDAGYMFDGNRDATLSLGLQNQDTVDLTRISFSAAGWTPLAPAHDASIAGLLGDHLISWYVPAGRLEFTPLFGGYSLGASERFNFTVQGFVPAQPIQLTVRKGEDVLEAHTIDLSHPACDRTPPSVSPLPTPLPAPPPEAPNISVYVLSDEDFTRPLSDAEKIAMWNQGLPVPMTETVVSSLAFKPGLMMPAAAPLAQSGEGWISMFSEDFEDFTGAFPASGQHGGCQLALLAPESISNTAVTDYQLGGNDYLYN